MAICSLPSTTLDISDPSTLSDRELMDALQAGNPIAVRHLYHRYGKLVHSLAYNLLKDAEDAQDLTQDVFLKLWRRKAYDANRGSLKTFLAVVTRSEAISRLRSRQSRQRTVQTLRQRLTQDDILPLELAVLEERSHWVRQALMELPPNEREVLEIAYYEDLSQSEVAAKLGLPLGTVKTRCRRGLMRLRDLLEEQTPFAIAS